MEKTVFNADEMLLYGSIKTVFHSLGKQEKLSPTDDSIAFHDLNHHFTLALDKTPPMVVYLGLTRSSLGEGVSFTVR